MKIAKRLFLFITVNLLIVATISLVTQMLGIKPYIEANGINYQSLIFFCLIWGFGASFISLAISRMIAKWSMGVQLIDEKQATNEQRWLLNKVHDLSKRAGLQVMPEVGIYESDDINAFATGPTKNRSLVAVSTGLLYQMTNDEIEGVLAHEVAHIANGDMVTMTLVQGVVNAFVMFLARIIGFAAGQFTDEEKRPIVQMVVTFALDILLGILGSLVTAYVSRRREFRADYGATLLTQKENMVAALQKLQKVYVINQESQQSNGAMASLQISGNSNKLLKAFSTHPDLDLRIQILLEQK